MKPVLVATLLFALATRATPAHAAPAHAAASADSVALVKLLHEFLDGAGRNDAAIHDRFWAEDLVYTGSAGGRRGKPELMKGVREAPAPKPTDPVTTYGAEEVRVRTYGSTAVVAFRLVASTREGRTTETGRYNNTGTFVKRAGKWQAVAWQATRIVPGEPDAGRDVALASTALGEALRGGRTDAIEALTDPSFVWTLSDGAALPRGALLGAAPGARFGLPHADSVSTATFGETAITRGWFHGHPHGSDVTRAALLPVEWNVAYSLTWLWRNGAWRALALETPVREETVAAR